MEAYIEDLGMTRAGRIDETRKCSVTQVQLWRKEQRQAHKITQGFYREKKQYNKCPAVNGDIKHEKKKEKNALHGKCIENI